MNNIITFLLKHVSIIVFIVLQTISISLYVNENTYQKSVFFEHTSAISAKTHSVVNYITDYYSLSDINDSLACEYAQLSTQYATLLSNVEGMELDSLRMCDLNGEVKHINAKIISKNTNDFRNYIIIDKGRCDGVEVDMGVISSEGVVGVTQKVSEHSSIVLPLINVEQSISVKIKSSNQLGTLVWEGRNIECAKMKDIPGHVTPMIGDTIITSGYSAIFQDGIVVGTVVKTSDEDNEAFRDLEVKLSVDFSSLKYVMVTKLNNSETKMLIEEVSQMEKKKQD